MSQTDQLVVAALYQFTAFADPESLKPPLLRVCKRNGVRGTILLANEGVNCAIAGTRDGVDAVLSHIRTLPGCADARHKESRAERPPFYRMKVRLKKEIVTMGMTDINPNKAVGRYVEPEDWNALITDPDVMVIDTRNDYEVGIGTFEGAVNPKTRTFREFPGWFKAQGGFHAGAFGGKRFAMFCTGGIRCEKATGYLLSQGVENVYHLKGGILNYLEKIPEKKSLYNRECFVFDQRVSVRHGLGLGGYDMCHACRRPITQADKAVVEYVEGVSCPNCFGAISAARKKRFAERQQQMELADARGEAHLGAVHEKRSSAKDDG